MNPQLFTDLAASEEASGFHANARALRAVPGIVSAITWIVEYCNEHPEWTEIELCNGSEDSAEACWLNSARAALAALDATEKEN